MSDETNNLKFVCEVCGKAFDAVSEAIVESEVIIQAVDEDGTEIELTEEQKNEVLKNAIAESGRIGVFAKGTICMCVECQDKMIEEADDVMEVENEE